MKRLMLFALLLVGVFTLAACNGDDNNDHDNGNGELRAFTLEELAEYDGLDGRDAYVAVDGDVYDVTASTRWIDGLHQGQVQAGQDLTEVLDQDAPHGREMLDNVPKIGYIVEEDGQETDNGYDDNDYDDNDYDNGHDDNDYDDNDYDNGDDDNDEPVGDNDEDNDGLSAFTLDELAAYDGLDGRDAYVAVDGYVYDVTASNQWTDGLHRGTIQAGQDLTHEIDNVSPHGRRTLDNVPKIGYIIDDNDHDNDTDDASDGYGY